MRITNNIHWDDKLERFKGADTAAYVQQSASRATKCASCENPLVKGAALSIIVDVLQGPNFSEDLYRKYESFICHRACAEPEVRLVEVEGLEMPEEITTAGSRQLLAEQTAFGTKYYPVLNATSTTNLTFRELGKERVAALTHLLLQKGCQLALSPDYDVILAEAKPADGTLQCVAGPDGYISFDIDGQSFWNMTFDPHEDGTAIWLQTVQQQGEVVFVGGDHLRITENEVDIDYAAESGSLVHARIPVSWTTPEKRQ